MKIMVTGASGFIGSNLCNRLNDLNIDYISIDKVNAKDTHIRNFYLCDMNDIISLKSIIDDNKPTHIIHLAARTDLAGKSLDDYNDNINVVKNLCEIINKLDYECFSIFASSMLVCKVGYIPDSYLDYSPSTYYGESKVIGERIVRNELDRYKSLIFRPTSIWGPGFKEPYKNFFDMVLKNRFLRIQGCNTKKTYGYIENSCNQILSLLGTKFDNQIPYYIGDAEPLNSNDWALQISEIAEIRKPLELPRFLFYVASKLGDLISVFNVYFPLTSFRLKNMTTENICNVEPVCKINRYPSISRKVAIKNTIEWLKNNEN